jgi:membrane fusion protein (multidrug efflux system)
VHTRRLFAIHAVIAAVLQLSGCGAGSGGAPAGGPPGFGGTTEVGYVVLQPTNVAVTTELTGRTAAFEKSEVRPQVSGVILERLFTEGSVVHAGQPLYRIDPSLYEAAVSQGEADLASAQASAEAAKSLAERYAPLAEVEAVSRQESINARAQAQQAEAAILQAQAQLKVAKINLRYTEVRAPITGRIGRSQFTVGALATANQVTPLAVINRLNPIYVDVQQSSAEWLSLKEYLTANGKTSKAIVKLTLENGSDYPHDGTVEFSEAIVNESTGTVAWRARFQNPEELLLPGMFVKAQVLQKEISNAFRVPQSALTRDEHGIANVLLIGNDDKVEQRTVTTAGTSGRDWIVTEGLQPGARVIVEGTGKVRLSQSVKPVLADAKPADAKPTGVKPEADAPSDKASNKESNSGQSESSRATQPGSGG